ncbi:MAG TPA: translation initiation factor IF-1 [Candidatus Ratteibacteria bacterium]|jgi:translation initiation factor IF-1|uniref:Translation initiation factor IF-1 n=1 Tax=candidate division TA06 bacterium ADurb.Bin131 TaxID=1852827 RepID=A0A1V6C4C1_UNCT6|nr:MAG: Translation initiation factor IF-1 [candidate division TA06 bacterium ADurb.Bin131]HON04857.1 translation initiation factor IF-1 [bacterium]HRS06158.1 translation initiation factor IF-1 [Candidatus Ratteibacteria bacterium]HPC29424.1 translation initiation factor IF-1 [bacterium]HQL65222.1 translation initiation factor IF-1 [bacterium]
MDKKTDKVILTGTINKALPGTSFIVDLENGMRINAHLCGKMRLHYIKIIPGDKVIVEISPYDITRGRIIKRL